MDLLSRYTAAVRSFLPQGGQADIIDELAANIQAEIDDRAAALGRPLTEGEQANIIAAHGHPMLVAGRYQSPQGTLAFGRQWIGPVLFPFYVKVLWFTLGLSLATHVVVIAALAVGGTATTVGGIMSEIALQVLLQFGVVTIIFAAVERSLPALTWDVHRPPTMRAIIPPMQTVVPRLQPIAEIIAILMVGAWLGFVYAHPNVLFGPAAEYRLGPIWAEVVVPTYLLLGLGMVQAVGTLVRPGAARFRLAMRVVADVGFLALVVYFALAHGWIVAESAAADPAALTRLNEYVKYGLWITALAGVGVIAVDAWRLARGWRQRAAR